MQFSWYGLILGFGFVSALWIFEHILQQETNKKLTERTFFFGILCIVIPAVIGARVYHLFTDWHLYQDQPWTTWIATWNGGLGIYGGLVGGLLGAFLWKQWFLPKLSFQKIIDALAITLPLGQAIGRFGNYVNQELFGPPTDLPWGIFIPENLRPEIYLDATHFHPLFLYEAIPNFLTFLGLLAFWKWQRKAKIAFTKLGSGIYFALYALSYGTVRFLLDFARWDLPEAAGTLTTSQWFSLGLIIFGLIVLYRGTRTLSLKKVSALILFLGSVLLLSLPTQVQAQAQTDFDLSVQPSVVELSIQPGKRVTQAFEIGNAGTKDLEATIRFQDFASDNTTGSPVLLDTNSFPYAELQNANVRLDEPFLLKADSSQQIVLAFDIPDTAMTQDWYFTMLVETRSLNDENLIGSQAQATGTIGSNILIRVTPTEYLPTNWDITLKNVPKILDSLQSATFQTMVTNDSPSLAQPDLSVVVVDWKGNIVYEADGLPDRVLANSTREIFAKKQRLDDPRSYEPAPFTFDPLFAIGPYTVRATIRNNEGGPIVVEKGFLALPISLLVGITFVIGLILALRAYKKSRSLENASI